MPSRDFHGIRHVPTVSTRLFVEEAKRQKTGTLYRRLQFEKSDPFA